MGAAAAEAAAAAAAPTSQHPAALSFSPKGILQTVPDGMNNLEAAHLVVTVAASVAEAGQEIEVIYLTFQ